MKRTITILILCISALTMWAQYEKIGKDYGNGLRRVYKGFKFGFIDKDGKEVIPLQYSYLEEFTNGRERVVAKQFGTGQAPDPYGKWGMIDKNGDAVVPFKYADIGWDYGNGLRKVMIFVKDNPVGLEGFINSEGYEVVPCKYYLLDEFTFGKKYIFAKAEDPYKCCLIDKDGKMAFPYKYDISNFSGDARIPYYKFWSKGKIGIIDNRTAEVIISPIYDKMDDNAYEGKIAVALNGKAGFIDSKTLKVVIPLEFDRVGQFSEGLAAVVKNGKLGFIDEAGKLVIPYKYVCADEKRHLEGIGTGSVFSFGLCWVANNNHLWAIIDKTGKELTEYVYEEPLFTPWQCDGLNKNRIKTNNNDGAYHYFDTNGRVYLNEEYRDSVQLQIIKKGAKDGDVRFCLALADYYWKKKEESLAAYWYEKVADKVKSVGNREERITYERLGAYYMFGSKGNILDEDKARYWLQKALEFPHHSDSWYQKQLTLLGGKTETTYRNYATVDWLSFQERTTLKDYQLKLGIKSKSKVEEVNVTVNGALTRGIKTVPSDGYDLTVDRTLALSEGLNRIVVSVRNGDGISTSEKVITYQGNTPTPVFNDKRIALVIGNAHYSETELILANPENDAQDVANKLKGLGFEVILKLDATLENMDKTLSAFGEKAKSYDVAMFYYAGHGIQSKGVNYLVPTNVENLAEDNLKYKCVDMERILDTMEDSGCKLKIVILDACRNNPLSRKWHRSTATRGLSIMNAPTGTIISFATAPGSTALDGTGRNSPYTEAFLHTLDMPNLDVFHFFQKVGAEVKNKTKQSQNPWWSSSFTGDFYFNKQQ